MDKHVTCFQKHLKIPQTVILSSYTHIVISKSSLSHNPRDIWSGPSLGWHWAPSHTKKVASMSCAAPLLENSFLLDSPTSLHQLLVLEWQEDPQLSADGVFSPAIVLPAGHSGLTASQSVPGPVTLGAGMSRKILERYYLLIWFYFL